MQKLFRIIDGKAQLLSEPLQGFKFSGLSGVNVLKRVKRIRGDVRQCCAVQEELSRSKLKHGEVFF